MRVVHGVGDVLVGQAQIGGVQHRAGARNAEIQLEVLVGVPGQRGRSVAGPHPDAGQGARQPPHARPEVGVGVAEQAPVRQARAQLFARKILLGALDDAHEIEVAAGHGGS